MSIQVRRRVIWTTAGGVKPATADCCPAVEPNPSFRRVMVDFLVEGGARITWDFNRDFVVPSGTYQLQVSQSGGANAEDWIDIGVPAIDPPYLVDTEKRMYGTSNTLHYRVLLVAGSGTYISPASRVSVQTLGSFGDWLKLGEVARKERLRFSLCGTQGFLLKERRYGILCSCVNPTTREQGNSSCPTCYGRNYVGGFYAPIPCAYGDLTPEEAKEFVAYNEGRGTIKNVAVIGRMLADVPVVQSDVWVSAVADQRYYVGKVKNLVEWRGVPIVYAVELRLAPKSDIVYKIPVNQSQTDASCNWGRNDLEVTEVICAPS